MIVYLEANDVGRRLNLGAAAVRFHVAADRLKPAAMTQRGTRLFTEESVEEFRRVYGQRKRRGGLRST